MLQNKNKFGSSRSRGGSLYVNSSNRKKRKKIIRIAIAWLIAAAILFFAIFGIVKLVKFCAGIFKDDFTFSHVTPENWAEHDDISVIKKDYAISIQYPKIDNSIDKAIKKDAEDLFDDLKSEIKQFDRGKKENRAVYTADYSVTTHNESYTSLLYSIHRYNPIRDINDTQYRTAIYDIASGKAVAVEQVFNDDYASVVSEHIINTLSADEKYKGEVSTKLFIENTSADVENFKNIGFSENSAILYFGAGEIFPSDMGEVSVEIPMRKLFPLMNVNITGYVPPKFDPDQPMIAFTFDDGPLTANTTRILDVLESVGGRATFFIIGDRLESHKDIVIRGDQLGCEYADHTWGHANLSKLSDEEITEQVTKTDEVLSSIIGKTTKYLRAPYGETNETIFKIANKPFVAWCVDTMDWQTRDSDSIYNELFANVKDGDIILMHDLYEATVDAFERAVPELINQGFQLVTVSELMEANDKVLTPGKIYYSGR